jgi:uncharacterized protein YecE (DUF72 family)
VKSRNPRVKADRTCKLGDKVYLPPVSKSPAVTAESDAQLELFEGEARAGNRVERQDTELLKRVEREHAESRAIAAQLPAGVFFGTSSWSFPEWAGIVYSRRGSPSELAREGLREYARHPLLTTVGIDRSFYAPIPRADLERYSSQLPPGFPCVAKAPAAVVEPTMRQRGGLRERNPDFLSASRLIDELVAPFAESFREHTGPFLLQFPPAPSEHRLAPPEFAEKLDRFLSALPRDFSYAVELRDAMLLTDDYRRALEAHSAAHVYNFATAMPMPADQERVVPLEQAPFALVRLLLPPGSTYEGRREELRPFDRISSPQPEMRRQILDLLRLAVERQIPISVLVNNKAEGCSPLTIHALAELLAEDRSR